MYKKKFFIPVFLYVFFIANVSAMSHQESNQESRLEVIYRQYLGLLCEEKRLNREIFLFEETIEELERQYGITQDRLNQKKFCKQKMSEYEGNIKQACKEVEYRERFLNILNLKRRLKSWKRPTASIWLFPSSPRWICTPNGWTTSPWG